jgi:hypothetical protein
VSSRGAFKTSGGFKFVEVTTAGDRLEFVEVGRIIEAFVVVVAVDEVVTAVVVELAGCIVVIAL